MFQTTNQLATSDDSWVYRKYRDSYRKHLETMMIKRQFFSQISLESHISMICSVAEIRVQCGAPKISKLVYNSNNYGLWYL